MTTTMFRSGLLDQPGASSIRKAMNANEGAHLGTLNSIHEVAAWIIINEL